MSLFLFTDSVVVVLLLEINSLVTSPSSVNFLVFLYFSGLSGLTGSNIAWSSEYSLHTLDTETIKRVVSGENGISRQIGNNDKIKCKDQNAPVELSIKSDDSPEISSVKSDDSTELSVRTDDSSPCNIRGDSQPAQKYVSVISRFHLA